MVVFNHYKSVLCGLMLVFVLGSTASLKSAYNANFLRGHDVGFLPLFEPIARKFTAGTTLEYGKTSETSYDIDGKQVPLLQMYAKQQASQAMLSDPVITFPYAENPEQWFVNSTQQTYNDQWGMFNVTGKFQEANVTFWGRGILPTPDLIPGTFAVAAYMPIKAVHIDPISWTDLSDKFALGAEERMIGFSSRLEDFVKNVGSLSLREWNKIGQGDLTVLLEWHHEFKREMDVIRHVRVDCALGVLVPTGRMVDIDQIFSIPLGTGGAWGMPFKSGLEICFHPKVSAGISVDMLWLADITMPRRLKTHINQTDYLLLSTGRARLQHARTWRFSLFGRAKLPVEGLSTSVSYHFAKTGDHSLVVEDNVFSSTVVNSQEVLKESSSHDVMFKLHFGRNQLKAVTAPGMSIFVKIPVGGRRMIKNSTFGGEFMFAF